jgi:poly(glycerol-phosphate) alpha-glucosyltransferase
MYERAHLKGAACIRALNKQEAASIAGLDLKVPICIVPNGIALPTHLDPPAPKWRRLIAPKKKVLLFIGRLHPKKGLSELIRAWHGLPSQRIGDWHLAIAGWDDGGHEDSLHALANRGPNSTSISFIGSVFGAEKDATLRHSNAFILPSKSEGLPMAVLEAWSYKLPVLMSRQCNLVEAFDNQCAIECGNTDSVIAQALLKLIALSTDEVDRLKDRAYGFVAERYTWVNISKQFESVCRWLVHHEAQPGCVVR